MKPGVQEWRDALTPGTTVRKRTVTHEVSPSVYTVIAMDLSRPNGAPVHLPAKGWVKLATPVMATALVPVNRVPARVVKPILWHHREARNCIL